MEIAAFMGLLWKARALVAGVLAALALYILKKRGDAYKARAEELESIAREYERAEGAREKLRRGSRGIDQKREKVIKAIERRIEGERRDVEREDAPGLARRLNALFGVRRLRDPGGEKGED